MRILGMSLHQHLMAGAAFVAVATASPAIAQTRQFNVPEQPASRGIPAFARQAGVQILASGNVVANRRKNAVRGNYSVELGLRILLQGTGLTTSPSAGGIITVRAAQSPGGAEAGPAPADNESADADQAGVAEILVFGRRSLNTDIRRTENDTQPYVVFDREDIRESQATNLQEFFRRRVIASVTRGSPEVNTTSDFGASSQIDLRGFGTDSTLVLVDGRRQATIGYGGSNRQANLNGIPLSAIESIQILPSSASGIYGGNAVGGVVNVVLRRDYSGIETTLRYRNTFDTDSARYGIEVAAGLNLTPRTNLMIVGSYSNANRLLRGDRDFERRGREQLLRNNPAAILNAPRPPLGFTTNIRSVSGANLVLDSGTPLNSPITFVPVG